MAEGGLVLTGDISPTQTISLKDDSVPKEGPPWTGDTVKTEEMNAVIHL